MAPAEMSPRRTTPQLRMTPVMWAVLVTAVLYVIHFTLIAIVHLEDPARAEITNVFMASIGVLASAALFIAARRSRVISRQQGVIWQWIAVGQAMYCLGDVAWTVIENIYRADAFPSVADAGYLLYYPLVITGLLLFPTRKLISGERLKLALDMAIVIVSSTLLLWTFVYGPLLQDAPASLIELVVTLLYPTLDMVLLWVLGFVILRQPAINLGLFLLFSSAVLLAAGDIVFNAQQLLDIYESGGAIDLVFSASVLFALLAGVFQTASLTGSEVRLRGSFSKQVAAFQKRVPSVLSFVLPYVWILLAFAPMVSDLLNVANGGNPYAPLLDAAALAVIILFVLARQTATLRENRSLSARLQTLLGSSHLLAAPMRLQDTPQRILTEMARVAHYDEAYVGLAHGSELTVYRAMGADAADGVAQGVMLLDDMLLAGLNTAGPVVLSQNVVQSGGTEAGRLNLGMLLERLRAAAQPLDTPMPASWVVAPLSAGTDRLGFIAWAARPARSYSPEQVDYYGGFARQVSAMIHSARLRQAEALAAATAERSRLSRDLHDSVLQALFAGSLGLRTAQQLLPDNPAQAEEAIQYSLRLAEGAISEMRALIFELRPETLATEGLLGALAKQVPALCDRHGIQSTLKATCAEPALSMQEKEMLYRIAIEAIQNAIKHSRATALVINAWQSGDTFSLAVHDNGVGFDAGRSYDGHLGLVSMRERAISVGAMMEIHSAADAGTEVRVSIHSRPKP